MRTIPKEAQLYREMPIWKGEEIPKGILARHNTKAGVWAKLSILKGTLLYTLDDTGETFTVQTGEVFTILPQEWHHIAPATGTELQDLEVQISFYRIDNLEKKSFHSVLK